MATTLSELLAHDHTLELPSADPSAYCQARRRLPLAVVQGLARRTVESSSHFEAADLRWCGRRVRTIDGSSVSMPDTPSLQERFPQVRGQKPGCGFPTARLVALFDWATGVTIDLVVDSLNVHEIHLARRLWHHLQPGDVLVGDRSFGSYADIARLGERGIDGVFRMQQRRKADYRQGLHLGPYDRLIQWKRPLKHVRPRGMSLEEWAQLPETLDVRIVRIKAHVKGFRSQVIHVSTSLLDPEQFPAEQIAALYKDRWAAELNLRSLKTHLGMAVLRGKSPDVVRKEVAMHMVAYNLIRLLMCEAAQQHHRDLHRLSFTGTMHRIDTVMPHLLAVQCDLVKEELVNRLLFWIAHDELPDRPDRIEPRRIKRRANKYSYLTRPRAEYKARQTDIDWDAR